MSSTGKTQSHCGKYFTPRRRLSAFLKIWPIWRSRHNLDFIFANKHYFSCGREAAEDQKHAQYKNSYSQQRILLIHLAIEILGGLSRTLRMTLLADSRNHQSVGHSIVFGRGVQSLSVIIQGSANMLLWRAP